MTGLIPLLQRVDQSRRICAEYIGQGHPHLIDLARDLPLYRMAAVDTHLADELGAAVATIEVDQVREALDNLWSAQLAAYDAGLMWTRDPAGEAARASDALTLHRAAVHALQDLLGIYAGPIGDAAAVCDLAARAREAAADRRELAELAVAS